MTTRLSTMAPVELPLPISRCLVYPPDGAVMEGRGVLFEWDLRHVGGRSSRSRLIVKRQLVGQSADRAISDNEIAFETLVEHVHFFSMNIAQLRGRSASYVWQVIALGEAHGKPAGIAASEIRTFSLAGGRSDIGSFISVARQSGESEPPQAAPVEAVTRGNGDVGRSLACPNGDFETGTLTGWQAYYGSRLNSSTIWLNNLSAGIINGRHTIRTLADGVDPLLSIYGVNLPQVGEGSYSVRLGNSSINGEADLLAYTFTVNAQNKNFTFRYALVLENPGDHDANEQPFFGYYIKRGSSIIWALSPPWSPDRLVTMRGIVADSNNPFFKRAGGYVYREWTPVCIDLSQYLGQTMTIAFYTADCSLGAHFGYAYIDGLCLSNEAVASFTMKDEICANADLWADGTASSNETSHFWSIMESDANWVGTPGTEVYQWFIAQHAGTINLSALYASKGGHFKCNTYYLIKLAVSNDCTPWNETSQLLHVKCPVVTAGPDACVSCTPNGQFTQLGVGNPSTLGTTYVWSPATGLNSPSSPSPLHTQGSVPYPMTYTVTATDAQGCANSDQVTLYCQPPTVQLSMAIQCCSVTLTALAAGYASIKWSTGQSGVLSIDVTTPGTYTVMVTNPCGSATASVVVPATLGLTGPFNPVAANSKFSPPSGSSAPALPAKMYIKDVIIGSPAGIAGVPHAYNATHYELRIFDRWGNLFRTIPGDSCDGFPNWSIVWDGTNDQGNLVQQDTYVWQLRFKNCQYTEWTFATERKYERRCVSWVSLFGVHLWCRDWEVITVDEDATGSKVTVVY
jgi:hypothetical protein